MIPFNWVIHFSSIHLKRGMSVFAFCSPCKSKVVGHIAAAPTAMPLVEPQIYPACKESPCEHDRKRRVNNADDPSDDCRDKKKQRNVEVTQLAERRADEDMVRHCLLDGYRKSSKVASQAMDIVVKQEVGVLSEEVQEQVSACGENHNREADDDEEYNHFNGAPERLQQLAV